MFTNKGKGCWIDGAFGHDRTRMLLACMIRFAAPESHLIAELEGPESDDLSEEDDALELLNGHCEPDVMFVFEAGDLLLVDASDLT